MSLLKRVVETYTGETVKRMESYTDPELPDVWAVRAWLEGHDFSGPMECLVTLRSDDLEECARELEEVEWEEWPPRQARSLNVFNR